MKCSNQEHRKSTISFRKKNPPKPFAVDNLVLLGYERLLFAANVEYDGSLEDLVCDDEEGGGGPERTPALNLKTWLLLKYLN